MLYAAVHKVHPGLRLKIEHSVSKGYYCRLIDEKGESVSPDVKAIEADMRLMVERDLPFERHEMITKDVIEIFRRQGLDTKVALLESIHSLYTTFYTLDGLADSYYTR